MSDYRVYKQNWEAKTHRRKCDEQPTVYKSLNVDVIDNFYIYQHKKCAVQIINKNDPNEKMIDK